MIFQIARITPNRYLVFNAKLGTGRFIFVSVAILVVRREISIKKFRSLKSKENIHKKGRRCAIPRFRL